MSRIEEALAFATQAHSGQKRKYTGDNYIVHPVAVAADVHKRGGNEDQVIAALLHDTVEDTHITNEDVDRAFGPVVAELVHELTDVFTHEAYPNDNRALRKKREACRLADISDEAKLIKLCDMIDNTLTIEEYDPAFARVYLAEKDYLYKVMGLDKLNNV